MNDWYHNGTYCLTADTKGRFSVSSSYKSMLGRLARLKTSNLIWNSIMLPRHRFILWLENQDKVLTEERLLGYHHLFSECSQFTGLKEEPEKSSGISLHRKGANQCLLWIQNRHRRQFKKEVATTVLGVMIYHTWRARNWKQFQAVTVDKELVITQIQKDKENQLVLTGRNSTKRF